MDKIILQTTTIKEFSTENEFEAFVTDLDNSGQFDYQLIEMLRNRQDYAVNELEEGYFTEHIKSQTSFKFLKE